jgi:MFS superfamily sulfate permease-like transporter
MEKNFSINDVKSGFLIFLIALPLSLGIAMASSMPPVAGVLTAMIGGMLATFLGSSRLTIKGPAAGLIVIVLGAVTELGQGDAFFGYRQFLAVGVASAILQIIFSRLKAGKIGSMMPPAVIHGMLAAIGVIIVAKQVHVLLGVSPSSQTPLTLLAEIPGSLMHLNPTIAFLGVLALAIVVFWPKFPQIISKKVPAALIVLSLVIPLGFIFQLGPKALVQLPTDFFGSLVFPDFSALQSATGWKYVIMLALVGSLESLLTVAAIDSVDPKKRTSNLDADLFSVGVANLVSAMIGGMPMISEVVRSKANIDNGAETKWSNFFHGAFIFVAVVFFSSAISTIPLAALAAMLIVTGFRLASPKEFYRTFKIGFDQIIIFSTTLMVTLLSDLLVGVISGLAVKILLHWFRGVPLLRIFKLPISSEEQEDRIVLKLKDGAALFSNYLLLLGTIQKALGTQKKVVLDLSEAKLIDHTTVSRLKQLSQAHDLELVGLHELTKVSKHELATHRALA